MFTNPVTKWQHTHKHAHTSTHTHMMLLLLLCVQVYRVRKQDLSLRKEITGEKKR